MNRILILIWNSSCSDPYVRIELNTLVSDVTIQAELTKTKKKVSVFTIW